MGPRSLQAPSHGPVPLPHWSYLSVGTSGAVPNASDLRRISAARSGGSGNGHATATRKEYDMDPVPPADGPRPPREPQPSVSRLQGSNRFPIAFALRRALSKGYGVRE